LEENGFYRSTITHSERQNPAIQQVESRSTFILEIQRGLGNISILGKSLLLARQIEGIARCIHTESFRAEGVRCHRAEFGRSTQKQNRWLAQVSITEKKYFPQSNTWTTASEIEPGPSVKISVEGFRLARGPFKRSVPVYEKVPSTTTCS